MKKLYLVLCLLWSSMAHSQITIQATVNGYGNEIIIGYWKDFTYTGDTLRLKKNKAGFKFESPEPVYFKLRTIDPDTFTPFLIGFPGDTIYIEKDTKHLVIKGGAENYNTFLIRLETEMRKKFSGTSPDYNTLTQFLVDRSEDFFSTFTHPQKQLIKDIHTLSIITRSKLYPIMTQYSGNASIMNSIANFIKSEGAAEVNGDDELKYLDKVNFNNPNIGFATITDIMMMNNLIRILRTHAIEKDTALKNMDEYVIENKIIKDLFKESRYRSRLIAYNLYYRINYYIEYPMQLAGADDFITDFRKEKFNTDLLPVIKKLYSSQLASIGSLSKGAVAPAFKLPDTKGKPVQLSGFKGKVVYLDIWATWCGPCLKEIPYLERLKEKFRNKDVEMITISIDTKVDVWLAKVAAMKMQGIQLIDSNGSTNSKIAKNYKVHGVPHYVLIDKNGRIASASAPRPSMEAEVEKQINELLQE
ncbi:TlpA disulfide reductase family protein [Agriterribacter sp.]|uniref:TlpA disulfide reductase family protein n=1 Tax=Agriterribacter sp. TaxID=2821509 RepID=UPI002C0732DF|nr:TlpA disulfide reductase family protein [Agriterribacter sp.]HRP54995.1 TlpA disulfide reductase family protein [Agriterribacter sp.]